jgi:phosphoenolpyruvate synthase/pyruvate phosphate dikinase
MSEKIKWAFIVKKRLSWISEMLQIVGTSRQYFKDSLDVECEFRNARMLLFHEYLDEDELAAFHAMVMREFRRESDYLHRVAERSYQRCNTFAELGRTLCMQDWSLKSDAELVHELKHFHQQALLMIPVVYFEPDVSESVRSLLLERLRMKQKDHEIDTYFLILTGTTRELTIIREQRDLLNIGASIQKSPLLARFIIQHPATDMLAELPPEIVSSLQKHLVEYAWINTDDVFGAPWTEADLLARLQYLLRKDCQERLSIAQSKQLQREYQREWMLKELPVDGELLALIEIARENSHLRTHRTEVYVRTLYEASGLLGEVARRVGLSYQNALYFSIDELLAALLSERPIAVHELKQRKAGMAYVMVDRKLQCFFGEDAIRLADKAGIAEESVLHAGALTGAIANMGVARGVVKVVHDISELGKVEEGDVLVASMTIPEFVPAMEKAAAFVTDEGGITCHAAIVSRELDIPCIIGVQIATRTLHDGDFVEVDANNGVVRILG